MALILTTIGFLHGVSYALEYNAFYSIYFPFRVNLPLRRRGGKGLLQIMEKCFSGVSLRISVIDPERLRMWK